MEIRKKCKDTYEDGNSKAVYIVNGVNDVNDVIQVINYFADEYGEIGNIVITHKNERGNYDLYLEYETVEDMSSFDPRINQYIEYVTFGCLRKHILFVLDTQKKKLYVTDFSGTLGPKFYSTDPAVRYAYYLDDDYGLKIRLDRNTSKTYVLDDDGQWVRGYYIYGKILDGDLREIDYDPSVTD